MSFTYVNVLASSTDSHLTGFICSLTDNTLSSIATFVLFTARVTPPAKPCLPEPRARPCQDIDRRHRARQLRPGQQGLDARLHTNDTFCCFFYELVEFKVEFMFIFYS